MGGPYFHMTPDHVFSRSVRYKSAMASPHLCKALGTGPAGPAAARPIFGQPTHAKIPYMSFSGLFNFCSKSARAVLYYL